MVKNYRYDKIENRFAVIEKATEQSIQIVDDKDVAKEMTRKLNGGLGFNGWTPPFFLLSIIGAKAKKKNENSNRRKSNNK